ncbi:5180_t:CDS:2 [Diversispora eburnea]|uniref:5180_t:CDS:1 n=1 Tax=Diversispora eburnea TaxID=1213867 RepID=A0A9N8ZTA1_9GLOM|nr:5180_t:CDS:2 [Diversispora eburnea]
MNPKIVATSTTTTTVTEKPDGGDPTNYCSIMHSSGPIILGATEKPDGGDPTNYCSIIELSKFNVNYFQGRVLINDLITEKSAFVDFKYEKKQLGEKTRKYY